MQIVRRGTGNPVMPALSPFGQPIYSSRVRFQGSLRPNDIGHNHSNLPGENSQLLGTQLLFGVLGFLGLGLLYLKRTLSRHTAQPSPATADPQPAAASEDDKDEKVSTQPLLPPARSAKRAMLVSYPQFDNCLMGAPILKFFTEFPTNHGAPPQSQLPSAATLPAQDVLWSISPPPQLPSTSSPPASDVLWSISPPLGQFEPRPVEPSNPERQAHAQTPPVASSRNTSVSDLDSLASAVGLRGRLAPTRSMQSLPTSNSWVSVSSRDGESPFSMRES